MADVAGLPSPATSLPTTFNVVARGGAPVSGPTKRHARVVDLSAPWRRIRDVFSGPDAVKARGTAYLPRPTGMEIYVDEGGGGIGGYGGIVDEYQNYLQRAVFLPFAARTRPGLVGMLFRTPPHCELPEMLAPHLDNITLAGQNWQAFARSCAHEILTTGWGAIAVDVATMPDGMARPFQRLYCAEAVTNWRIEIIENVPVLTQVVLCEQVEEPAPDGFGVVSVEQYRVMSLAQGLRAGSDGVTPVPGAVLTVQLYRQLKTRAGQLEWVAFGAPIVPTRRGEPLPFIPVVPFHVLGATWEPQPPPLLQLVDHNLAHYRNSADYENGVHYCGVPTPVAAGFPENQKFRVGGTGAWVSSNPQAHAEYLQTGGQGLAELRQAMMDKREEMAILAARVLLGSGKRAPETADAMRIAATSDDATLNHIALALEQALRQAAIWHVWWAGTGELAEAEAAVEVTFASEFVDTQLDADEAVKMMALVQEGLMSWDSFFYNMLRGGRVPPTRTQEEERALIDADRERFAPPPPEPPDMTNVLPAEPGSIEALMQQQLAGKTPTAPAA